MPIDYHGYLDDSFPHKSPPTMADTLYYPATSNRAK